MKKQYSIEIVYEKIYLPHDASSSGICFVNMYDKIGDAFKTKSSIVNSGLSFVHHMNSSYFFHDVFQQ